MHQRAACSAMVGVCIIRDGRGGDSNIINFKTRPAGRPGMMEHMKLPMWTEIHIQPLDIDRTKETKIFWIKHPRLKTSVYHADLSIAIVEFLQLCKENNIKD